VRSDHEQSVTVTVTGSNGQTLTCSALLERDPGYLHWNRMSLLGDRRAMLDAMKLVGGGLVHWRLHQRDDMPGLGDYTHEEFGSAILRSVSMTTGINIAETSVQKIARLELFESTERVTNPTFDVELGVTYWFLQRPPDWDVYSRAWSKRADRTQRGPWQTVAATGLRFRLLQIGHVRREPRRSLEKELIEIPAVEIEPATPFENVDAFFDAAEKLWFTLRIGIVVWHRQYTQTLAEFRNKPSCVEQIWHPEVVEPMISRDEGDQRSFRGAPESFLKCVSTALMSKTELHGQVHAAAVGYARSFRSFASESALTACVEAIERLLVAFEIDGGLSRELVERKDWSRTAKRLKAVIDSEGWSAPVTAAAKRFLASSPTLSLQDRIERMARHYRRRRGNRAAKVFEGIEGMVRQRNALVHGRKVDNHQLLYIETVRARALFEQLFLDFARARHAVEVFGAAEIIIGQFEHLRSRAGDTSTAD
jgi:hypothetical protein